MLSWLWKKNKRDSCNSKQKIPTIDVSGPEYHDLFPSRERIVEILSEEEVLRPNVINRVADIMMGYRGHGSRDFITKIVRSGSLLPSDELRSLGLRANRKIGRDFVDMLSTQDIDYAVKFLDSSFLFAHSEANKLHGLRRNEELGMSHVIFSSAKDERNTDIENKFEGARMTIKEARMLVKMHGRKITRSIFITDTPKDFIN